MWIIDKLLKRHSETFRSPYVEMIERLIRAKTDLMIVEDYLKESIKTFNNIKEYLPMEYKLEEFSRLNTFRYHVEDLKERIEYIEKIIKKAQEDIEKNISRPEAPG